MANPIPRFETGDTRMFSVTFSTAPGTAPLFTITCGSGASTLVQSITCTSSSSTQWFAMFTITANSPNLMYRYAFVASYTDGPVVNAGLFHAVRTDPF